MLKHKWVLLISMLINMGIGLVMPITTIYIHTVLGKPLSVAGTTLLFFSGASMVGNVIGGRLFDRWSHKGPVIVGQTVASLSLLIIGLSPTWPLYPIVLVFYGLGIGTAFASFNGLVAILQADEPLMFNYSFLAANVGMAVGSLSAGVLFAISIHLTFLVPGILFGLAVLIDIFKLEDGNAQVVKESTNNVVSKPIDGALRSIVLIAFAFFVIWIGYSQWNTNLSTYMTSHGATVAEYSALFTLNAVILVLIQPFGNRILPRIFPRKKYQVIFGTVVFACSFLMIIHQPRYINFVMGMLLLTFGEMIVMPTIPAWLNEFATPDNRGTIQSISSLAGGFGRAVGPLLGSLIIEATSYPAMFLWLCAADIVGAGLLILAVDKQPNGK
ncbi:MFS transporter [Furfurilactobacillus milii]|uniref:MFS transporter n=1 Tax=Furfurilactobacillus milii TaxID=2888272 RepID=UPI00136E5304